MSSQTSHEDIAPKVEKTDSLDGQEVLTPVPQPSFPEGGLRGWLAVIGG